MENTWKLINKKMNFYSIVLFMKLLFHPTLSSMVIELGEEYGVLESPGFPQHYRDHEDITWNISAPTGYQIEIRFPVFDLEDSFDEDLGGACPYDYLQIENHGQSQKLCGNHEEFPDDAPSDWKRFRSENNNMIIRFVSDYSNETPLYGFQGHYVVKDQDECEEMEEAVRTAYEDWDQLIYCNHYCVNVPGTYYCTCRPGFDLHDNMHTCKGSCQGEVISAEEGFIVSPDYPKPYPRLTDCDWTIQVQPGFSLNLQFNENFEIENHINYTQCVYDYLKVVYGDTEALYCHESPNNGSLIHTNSRKVRLEFHTDNSIELSGFNMTFTTTRQRCLVARDAPNFGEKSPNPKGYYEFEDVVEFSCYPGYNLVGPNQIICQNNGTWSDVAPTCQIKSCGYPVFLAAVPYSRLYSASNLNYTFQDVIEVQCMRWYEMTSGLAEWRCSENAEWIPTSPGSDSSHVPECSPICGLKNGDDRPLLGVQIAGGEPSNPHEWPWLVFINIGFRANVAASGGTCGGALISPDFVLTAAHCVTGADYDFPPNGQVFPNTTHVWIGAHNRLQDRIVGNTNARSIRVEEVLRHPDYNIRLWDSDVALLRLAETVVMNNFTRPICLPNTTQEFDLMVLGNTSGEVAGWGLSSARRTPSYTLRHTELPTVTTQTCWRGYQETARDLGLTIDPRLNLTENMFCAGRRTGDGGSTCEGDSGGPYMVEDISTQKYYSFGVVSFGLSARPCSESVSYSAFAYLRPNILDWINNVIN